MMILVVYCGAMFVINLHYTKLPPRHIQKKRILIVGDSHPKQAINPALLPSAYNIAIDAQPYCITYWTLKKVLKTYGCDTVLIAFSYHNISAFNDQKFSDKLWSSEMFARIYTLVPLDSLKDFKFDKMEYYHTIFRNMLLYPKPNPIRYIGKYNASKLNHLYDNEDIIQRHYYYNGKIAGISKTSIRYLNLIISLCKKNGVTPILVTTPLHRFYRNRIPALYVNGYDSLKADLVKQNIKVLDFSSTPFNDKEFLNSDHLNGLGSTRFTHLLDSTLNAGRK